MSDITSGGAGGLIGAAFVAGVNWASKFIKKTNGNGNHASEKEINQAAEIATLKAQVAALSNMPALHNGLMTQVTEIATILNKGVVPELEKISYRLSALEGRT